MSDALFGIHAKALSLGRARMDVLAANIANADTPHYLAKDVDFAQALKAESAAGSDSKLLTTDDGAVCGVRGAKVNSTVR